jgi:fumarate hydratase subunit alpha
MREIQASEIKEAVKKLFLDANFYIGEDVLAALKEARDNEPSETGRSVLDTIIENHQLAREEQLAICQDTGLAVLFVELGQDVDIVDSDFREAVNQGVEGSWDLSRED